MMKIPQKTIDELMNKCYEDGFEDGRIAEHDRKFGDDPEYRKGHADGVQEVRDYMIKQVGYCHFGE